jgi:hypothetical protein
MLDSHHEEDSEGRHISWTELVDDLTHLPIRVTTLLQVDIPL